MLIVAGRRGWEPTAAATWGCGGGWCGEFWWGEEGRGGRGEGGAAWSGFRGEVLKLKGGGSRIHNKCRCSGTRGGWYYVKPWLGLSEAWHDRGEGGVLGWA